MNGNGYRFGGLGLGFRLWCTLIGEVSRSLVDVEGHGG